MNSRRTKALLYGITVAIACAVIAVIVAGAACGYASGDVPSGDIGIAQGNSAKMVANPTLPPLSRFEAVWSLDLRRPLVDPPPPLPVVVTPPPKPPLAIKLAGTIIERGHAYAMIQTPEGKVELKSVGDSAAGADILSIDNDSVTVKYLGETMVLKVEKAGQS